MKLWLPMLEKTIDETGKCLRPRNSQKLESWHKRFVIIHSIANKIFHPFEQNRPFKFELCKRCDQEVFTIVTLEEAKLGHKMLRKQFTSRSPSARKELMEQICFVWVLVLYGEKKEISRYRTSVKLSAFMALSHWQKLLGHLNTLRVRLVHAFYVGLVLSGTVAVSSQ